MNACVLGKTLAFGVPALMHILQKGNKKTSKKAVPRCLVLSPTRELAQQVGAIPVCLVPFSHRFHKFFIVSDRIPDP